MDHDQLAPAALGEVEQAAGLGRRRGGRFLDHHVATGSQRRLGDLGMVGRRGADVDDVEVAGEPVVAGGERPGAPEASSQRPRGTGDRDA